MASRRTLGLADGTCPTCGRKLPKSRVGDTKLAKALFGRRCDLVLTVRQAADKAGVDPSTFWRAESGKTPDLATFVKLAKWLGGEMEDLV
jgi:DNA-binding XRE family transcriptional regulator